MFDPGLQVVQRRYGFSDEFERRYVSEERSAETY